MTVLILLAILLGQVDSQAQPGSGGIGSMQLTITGVVVDSTFENPLPYANVTVFSPRRDRVVGGAMTDQQGRFRIEKVPPGEHQVIFEFIGYQKKTIGPQRFIPGGAGLYDLGEITLETIEMELDDVEVQGEQPLYHQTPEMKVFDVEQSAIARGGSALEALEQIPGVEVDIDGKVSLRGSTNVRILLDGRPSLATGSDQEMVLEAIPANTIQDIEIITNPSARYDPEGMAGIINIVLKENNLAGLNGSVSVGGATNGAYNASGQLNYRNEKMNLFINSGLRHDLREASGDNYRETYQDDSLLTTLYQDLEGERGGDSRLVKTGAEFYLNRLNTIGFNIAYNNREGKHDREVIAEEWTGDSLLRYSQISTGDSEQNGIDGGLFWDRRFTRPQQQLSLSLDLSHGWESRPSSLETVPAGGYEDLVDYEPEKSSSDLEQSNLDMKLDYTYPVGEELRLEVGYKGTLRYLDNDYRNYSYDSGLDQFLPDDSLSNHFRYDENIQAVYGLATLQRGRLSLQGGLRGELVEMTTELRDTDEHTADDYISLYPSGAITCDLMEHLELQSSYSRRVRRPRDRQLNPSIHKMDESSIRMGNPYLRPEYTDVVELSLSHFYRGMNSSVTAYYRRTTDKINRFKELRDDGVSVMTYQNFNEQTSRGLELVFSGAVLPPVRLLASGNIYWDEVDASNLVEEYDETAVGYSGRFSTMWNITPMTEFVFSSFYRSARDIAIGEIDAMFSTDFALKQRLMDERLSLSLRVSDPFDTRGFGFTTYDENHYQESNRKFASRRVMLSLEYRFGELEDRRRSRRDRSSDNYDQNGFGIE